MSPTGRRRSIYIYDAAGTYQRAFNPPAEATGWQPLGMAFDAAGNLYVTDVGSDAAPRPRVRPAGPGPRRSGEARAELPERGRGRCGRLRVRDRQQQRPARSSSAPTAPRGHGRAAASGDGNLGLPRGVAVDGQGRVYVVDTSGQAVFVYGQYKAGAEPARVPRVLRDPGRRATAPSPTPTASRSTDGGGCTSPTRPTTACSCGATEPSGREGGGIRSYSVSRRTGGPHSSPRSREKGGEDSEKADAADRSR